MRKSIATVCLSGGLVEKLHACAAAGFDGVEIFEPDLVAGESSPEEIRALAARLGLSIDLYQPLRDIEGVEESQFADNLRRAEAKFALMKRLGADTVLVCSNVATATVDSDEVSAAQLRALGDLAGRYGVRIAFEALAWGRYVDDYRRAWRIVRLADHPRVGLCLDSFHILSRGHDSAQIASIPAEKIFFLQLADAPALSMDVLSWSRHHRLFPGEGSFDLVTFLTHVLRTGYAGPLSLEVFNDTFRQTDTRRTATHALRSLAWLEDQAARRLGTGAAEFLTEAKAPTGFDFVEIRAEDTDGIEVMLGQLGFSFRGVHRSRPARLWTSGTARIVLDEHNARDTEPLLTAVGLDVPDPLSSAARAHQLMAPPVHRRTYASGPGVRAVAAPEGTEIHLCAEGASWAGEFTGGATTEPIPASTPGPGPAAVTHVDHVNLAPSWADFDESVLFYTTVLDLDAAPRTEVPSPHGLVRSQVMHTPDGAVRLPLNMAPSGAATGCGRAGLPQHIAFACPDVTGLARAARDRGLRLLPVPANYYDDLAARFGLAAQDIARLRESNVLYDRDAHGHFLHFYTRTTGTVFLEFVQRVDGYAGFGADNAPIRLAAQSLTSRL
ncbi:bifunctional sugar phosphate isomerase/epimerase/4-hydroxyphenylpyruvate dioxygenase family protein [Streptomyces sp. NPDC090106]|uniref:bifunctional sugar phosphate isomerase/epimerase/4-hydroxyphenylpyruvate dioxygenase family protein n=1 Tax=Streptomyces sp. NPDC090106 TaxID=3365946 RepID=UPI0037F85A83